MSACLKGVDATRPKCTCFGFSVCKVRLTCFTLVRQYCAIDNNHNTCIIILYDIMHDIMNLYKNVFNAL